ncbi:MAG: type II toxin-antitoxin system VapC family toxin [Syntrophomonas sp.]|nr:type II toxin-antitoxin system VapC family toxin [Syntrophomonas sp.]
MKRIKVIYAPRLLILELVNASLLAFRRGRIDETVFNRLVDTMTSLQISWIDIESDSSCGRELAQTAREHQISAYDAAYIQVAKRLNCKLVTGDIKLVAAVGAPMIRLENYYPEDKN